MKLHIMLFLIVVALFGTTIYSYIQYNKNFYSLSSPHFVLLISLSCQIWALLF